MAGAEEELVGGTGLWGQQGPHGAGQTYCRVGSSQAREASEARPCLLPGGRPRLSPDSEQKTDITGESRRGRNWGHPSGRRGAASPSWPVAGDLNLELRFEGNGYLGQRLGAGSWSAGEGEPFLASRAGPAPHPLTSSMTMKSLPLPELNRRSPSGAVVLNWKKRCMEA